MIVLFPFLKGLYYGLRKDNTLFIDTWMSLKWILIHKIRGKMFPNERESFREGKLLRKMTILKKLRGIDCGKLLSIPNETDTIH
jgi:hypothetical protein